MRVYAPTTKEAVGGGWTFLRNFRKGMQLYVEFVNTLEEADLLFIAGVTMVERDVVERATELNKYIVFRMDNIPRKSRNHRSRVYDNIKRYAELADVVVYQSNWAQWYCQPMSGEGMVIYNGVDPEIFNMNDLLTDDFRNNNYLFLYHGKSELKQFWVAHYYFQLEARKNPQAQFWFVYNFKSELGELESAGFDFWNNEQFKHLNPVDDPEAVAVLMKQCKYLIFPSVCDAAPNTVLEAKACGMEILYAAPEEAAGTRELLNPIIDISLDRMCREYDSLFKLVVTSEQEIET